MRTPTLLRFAGVSVLMLAAADLLAAVPRADIPPAARRRTLVDLAVRFAEPATIAPLPQGLVHPFNPVAFGQPDPEELRAIAAARAAAAAAAAQGQPQPAQVSVLDRIADRITPSGTLELGGQPYLIFGQKRLRVGDLLTVTFEGQDHHLELVQIDRTTFTLRLDRDEITRPIKPRK